MLQNKMKALLRDFAPLPGQVCPALNIRQKMPQNEGIYLPRKHLAKLETSLIFRLKYS